MPPPAKPRAKRRRQAILPRSSGLETGSLVTQRATPICLRATTASSSRISSERSPTNGMRLPDPAAPAPSPRGQFREPGSNGSRPGGGGAARPTVGIADSGPCRSAPADPIESAPASSQNCVKKSWPDAPLARCHGSATKEQPMERHVMATAIALANLPGSAHAGAL